MDFVVVVFVDFGDLGERVGKRVIECEGGVAAVAVVLLLFVGDWCATGVRRVRLGLRCAGALVLTLLVTVRGGGESAISP